MKTKLSQHVQPLNSTKNMLHRTSQTWHEYITKAYFDKRETIFGQEMRATSFLNGKIMISYIRNIKVDTNRKVKYVENIWLRHNLIYEESNYAVTYTCYENS